MLFKFIVLRVLLSLYYPIILYSIGYGILNGAGLIDDFWYWNPYAWAIILFLAIFPPTSQIFLFMIFKPIELYLRKKIRVPDHDNQKKGFANRGNFLPVQKEMSYEIEPSMITSGQVPKDITGVFLKNGPNNQFTSSSGRTHWFEGDGMIHAIRIKDGKLWYCNRYTETPKYLDSKKAGQDSGFKLGELWGLGVLLAPIVGLQQSIGYLPTVKEFQRASANTALMNFSKKSYALVEVDYPFHIKPDLVKNELDVKSQGYDNFDGNLNHNCSAHPKIDQKTNELFIFGYSIRKPALEYTVLNKDRTFKCGLSVPISSTRMIHDFQITESYAIFPDLPLEGNPKEAIKNKHFMFHFFKDKPCRYGIIPRYSTNIDEIKWFDVPAHYVFHFVNSWEDKNDLGETVITMFAVVWDNADMEFSQHEHFWTVTEGHHLKKLTFNLSTGKCEIKMVMEDYQVEFPVINLSYTGYKNRYAYLAFTNPEMKKNDANKDDLFLNGFIKYDLLEEKMVAKVSLGDTKTAGEVMYQQRDGSDPENEDDGYLMTVVYDAQTKTSEFDMWDSKNLPEETAPCLCANLHQRVPNGFHTLFVQEDQMEK